MSALQWRNALYNIAQRKLLTHTFLEMNFFPVTAVYSGDTRVPQVATRGCRKWRHAGAASGETRVSQVATRGCRTVFLPSRSTCVSLILCKFLVGATGFVEGALPPLPSPGYGPVDRWLLTFLSNILPPSSVWTAIWNARSLKSSDEGHTTWHTNISMPTHLFFNWATANARWCTFLYGVTLASLVGKYQVFSRSYCLPPSSWQVWSGRITQHEHTGLQWRFV